MWFIILLNGLNNIQRTQKSIKQTQSHTQLPITSTYKKISVRLRLKCLTLTS